MTANELRTQTEQARSTVRELQKAVATSSGDFDADLATETQLTGAERLLERLERRLSELQAREEADREIRAREATKGRLSEVEAEYEGKCSDLAQVVNQAATFLEPVMEAILNKRRELAAMSNEYYRLFKQVHGRKPDELERLWSNAGLVPSFDKIDASSPLYPYVYFALLLAVNEAEGRPLTLLFVEGAVNAALFGREAEKPTLPTPKAPGDDNPTEMQKFARARRTHWE